MAIKFRFRWIPFAATLLAVLLGISLGNWQMRRASEKEAIESRINERQTYAPLRMTNGRFNEESTGDLAAEDIAVRDIEFRRVTARGKFEAGWPVYLDNRPYKGVAGFHLLMPLKVEGTGKYVLVARGWFPRDPIDRIRLPQIAVPQGTVEVEGVAKSHAGHLLQLGEPAKIEPGAILQNLDIAQFASASRLPLYPFIVEQTNDLQDGLTRDWDRPSSGIDKHLGYAFQWYGLAATALVFFIVTGFRRGTKQAVSNESGDPA